MDLIGKYFNRRLATAFAGVAPNPYTLRNTRGVPLFLLCFAAANPHAAKTAMIATRISSGRTGRDAQGMEKRKS